MHTGKSVLKILFLLGNISTILSFQNSAWTFPPGGFFFFFFKKRNICIRQEPCKTLGSCDLSCSCDSQSPHYWGREDLSEEQEAGAGAGHCPWAPLAGLGSVCSDCHSTDTQIPNRTCLGCWKPDLTKLRWNETLQNRGLLPATNKLQQQQEVVLNSKAAHSLETQQQWEVSLALFGFSCTCFFAKPEMKSELANICFLPERKS